MQIKNIHILSFIVLFFLTACIEEYWPELDKYENSIVVDGIIHDGEGPYKIVISRTTAMDNTLFNGVANATVKIVDENGLGVNCVQGERGYYFTPDTFRCDAGKRYQLQFRTMQGERYESDFVSIPKAVEIQDIKAEIETRVEPEYFYDQPGVQFYVTTAKAETDTCHFLWQMTETWEYHSDFQIFWVFDGNLRPMTHIDSLRVCYRTRDVTELATYSTTNQQVNQVNDYPILFVDTETRKLAVKYSLYVKQYTISKTDYQFWNAIEEQSGNQSGLYTTQPYQVKGNLHCISNSDEPVLGNFTAAGFSAKRIMFEPPATLPFYYNVCEVDTSAYMEFYTITSSPPSTWPVYATKDPWGHNVLINQDCMDCTDKGGVLEKPEFW